MATTWRDELIHRLLAGQCELCEGRTGLQVHHVRNLADLNKLGRPERPSWVRPPGHPRGTEYSLDSEMTTGEPDAGTTGLSGSGRGRRKRTRATGTSSAACFTRPCASGSVQRLIKKTESHRSRTRSSGSCRSGTTARSGRTPGPSSTRLAAISPPPQDSTVNPDRSGDVMHTAVHNPDAGPDAVPRRSIEACFIAFSA